VRVLPRTYTSDAFRDEVVLGIEHPNLVKMHGILGGMRTCIAMQLCLGGDLGSALHDPLFSGVTMALPVSKRITAAVDVIRGAAHLHAHNIVHRAVNPANAFLMQPLNFTPGTMSQVRLGEYVVSRVAEAVTMTNTKSCAYIAPEILSSNSSSFASDVYAIGFFLYELVTGREPFVSVQRSRIPQFIMEGHRPPLEYMEITGGNDGVVVQPFVNSCWQSEPLARPTVSDLMQDLEPWSVVATCS